MVALRHFNDYIRNNVDCLKNIKRQMYGRSGVELLKRKVILA